MTTAPDYKQLIDNLATAVILVDRSFQIRYLNTAAESLLQISLEQAIGVSLIDYFNESTVALNKMQKAFVEGQQYTKRKARWHLHSGSDITIDYTVTPLNDKEHLLLEVQVLDRLLRINRDEALLAAQATTKSLVLGLAHEVKNPLGGIRGAAQLLDKELATDNLKEYTHVIIAESDRLCHLVDQMLGSRHQAVLQPTNIHEALERVISIIKAEVAGKISLQRQYDPSIPEASADVELLIQALLNIARNAMQALLSQIDNKHPCIIFHTCINRQFTIGPTCYPLVANISIEDNGPGIPETIIDDIFYPMISGKTEGSGLGLAISQQLITQHRGLIKCVSEPGKTIFSIYIPLEENNE